LKQIFPTEFLDSFSITGFDKLCDISTRSEFYTVYIDERLKFPLGHVLGDYESKGFDQGKTVQDFPIRGKAVYLVIRTRLWRHKSNGKIIKNNYSYIAQGAKLTQELSDFLKCAGQYQG
jgi:hypothetical protein